MPWPRESELDPSATFSVRSLPGLRGCPASPLPLLPSCQRAMILSPVSMVLYHHDILPKGKSEYFLLLSQLFFSPEGLIIIYWDRQLPLQRLPLLRQRIFCLWIFQKNQYFAKITAKLVTPFTFPCFPGSKRPREMYMRALIHCGTAVRRPRVSFRSGYSTQLLS